MGLNFYILAEGYRTEVPIPTNPCCYAQEDCIVDGATKNSCSSPTLEYCEPSYPHSAQEG